mmetsp:Transcript_18465/g.55133  ORF Transcript_18465/g.55133 Transcript_18465/m.55133 type:complete len:243 (+) Transcript_18465:514-1242(+)
MAGDGRISQVEASEGRARQRDPDHGWVPHAQEVESLAPGDFVVPAVDPGLPDAPAPPAPEGGAGRAPEGRPRHGAPQADAPAERGLAAHRRRLARLGRAAPAGQAACVSHEHPGRIPLPPRAALGSPPAGGGRQDRRHVAVEPGALALALGAPDQPRAGALPRRAGAGALAQVARHGRPFAAPLAEVPLADTPRDPHSHRCHLAEARAPPPGGASPCQAGGEGRRLPAHFPRLSPTPAHRGA